MTVGIISGRIRERERKLFSIKPKLYTLSEDIIAAEIPFSKEEMEEISRRRIEKSVAAAKKMLCKAGAGKILLARPLEAEASELFYKIAAKALELSAKRFSVKLSQGFGIRQKAPDFKAEKVISDLIYESDDIRLFAENLKAGEEICERIMSKYGAAVRIFPYNTRFFSGAAADLDKNCVEIGNYVTLCDFETDIEQSHYDIDPLILAAACGVDLERAKPVSCRYGKNKLTL